MKYKNFDIKFKESTENSNGILAGYCATFVKTPDVYGDVIRKGAFLESINRLVKDGKTLPLLFSHQLDNLDAYLGKVTELREDDFGLYFEAEFDSSEKAQYCRQLYKDGRLSKFSFAYTILDEGPIILEDGTKANELRKLDILEISMVLVPANPTAEVTAVKSDKIETKEDSEEITEKSDSDNAAQAEDQSTLNGIKEYLLLLIKSME